MCGFTGFYQKNTTLSRSELHVTGKKMAGAIAHRGPDSAGLWQDPDLPLMLAFQRLAIIDLTEDGNQPMLSASERYAIVYNGEIYNYLDLQKDLKDLGFEFRSRSDTEVILAAIEHWGLNQTLQKLNGMFAIALWDRQDRKLHLIRDRLGKKPVYVGWVRQGKDAVLVFGSELKALRAHPDFKPEICRKSLSLFMRYGYIPAPHCIYKGVWSLPAGHRLTLDIQNLEEGSKFPDMMEPFWHHLHALEEAKDRKTQKSDEQVVEEFEGLLTNCVRDRLISDVPLGAFLSGGIDSSAVVALMQKTAGQPVKTYSIGFQEEGFDEAAYAKKIAAHLGTNHHELYLSGQDALDTIPQLPDIFDEPFADISAIPTYLVAKFARQNVTVALSGDGGDEMLGGYTRHFMAPKLWKRMRLCPLLLRKAFGSIVGRIPGQSWDRLVKSKPQFGAHMHKLAAVMALNTQEDMYQRLLSKWPEPPVINGQEPIMLLSDPDYTPKNLSFAEKMMYFDALSYLPNDILVKVDRATMAVSLEARAPLLDRRIYDYVWSLPEGFKIRNGQGKWLLRQVLKRHVPENLYERPKQGFNIPAGEWLRGPLKDWAEDLLDEKQLKEQGLLDAGIIRQTWQDHLNGRHNHGPALWAALMFQAWQKRWL